MSWIQAKKNAPKKPESCFLRFLKGGYMRITMLLGLMVAVGLSVTVVQGKARETETILATATISGLALQEEDAKAPETDRFGIETTDDFARASLVFWQTLHGVLLGAESCALLACDSTQAMVGSLMLGGGAGLASALLATQEGITPGHSDLLNSATGWGLWDALALNFILDPKDERASAGLMMGGQLAGLGTGIAAWEPFRPTAGDVALINSSGIWSGVLTGFMMSALELDLTTRETFGVLLTTTNLGGVAGAWLANTYPMGTGRVFVINASGIVGALTGFGAALFIAGDDVKDPLLFGAGIAGTLIGLGTGVYFTQDWSLMPPQQSDAQASGWQIDLLSGSWLF